MKRILLLVGVLVLVMAAVWAFTSRGSHLESVQIVQAQEADKPQKEIVIAVEKVVNGESAAGEVRLIFEDAPEVPKTSPDAFGVFLGKSGNTLRLGSGAIEVTAEITVINDQEPVRDVQVSHDGEEISFQVNAQTVYLHDVTQRPEITDELLQQSEVIVPGTVAPGALEGIGPGTVLRVWGTIQDGVLVAELVVYETVE